MNEIETFSPEMEAKFKECALGYQWAVLATEKCSDEVFKERMIAFSKTIKRLTPGHALVLYRYAKGRQSIPGIISSEEASEYEDNERRPQEFGC